MKTKLKFLHLIILSVISVTTFAKAEVRTDSFPLKSCPWNGQVYNQSDNNRSSELVVGDGSYTFSATFPGCLYVSKEGFFSVDKISAKTVGGSFTLTWNQATNSSGNPTFPNWYYDINGIGSPALLNRVFSVDNETLASISSSTFANPLNGNGSCVGQLSCTFKITTNAAAPLEGFHRVNAGFGVSQNIGSQTIYDNIGRSDTQIELKENAPPKASFVVRRSKGLTYILDGSASSDDERVAEYSWGVIGLNGIIFNADQNIFNNKVTPEVTFPKEGVYRISLKVVDMDGFADLKDMDVLISLADESSPPPTGVATPTPVAKTANQNLKEDLGALPKLLSQVKVDKKGKLTKASSVTRTQILKLLQEAKVYLSQNLASIKASNSKVKIDKQFKSLDSKIRKSLKAQRTFKSDLKSAKKELQQLLRVL